MVADPDRHRRIHAAAKELREAPRAGFDDDSALGEAFRAAQGVEEIIALLVASCRAHGRDEVEAVEIVVRAFVPPASREELTDWHDVLAPLGYGKVSLMLRRLAQSAPSRPAMSVLHRIMANRRARAAPGGRAG